ncbi:small conductance mechanosensitive channel [Silvimonas terrae]|uniref:Small conductance mechanosensitive channel n=1 Tax=Silvimonas terrae TaxID=300266 RepID=A0A840RBX6_9NEIS|nr:mechanosensitive ion channel domain-containing protein [Silvimonas terrae]MBB5189832.1 small conductance mechanosensitive channel [Silvimonas terrae]
MLIGLTTPALAVAIPGLTTKPDAPPASAASAVAFAASLDNVITTLEDDQRRDALVAELKRMRTVASAVAQEAQAQQNNGLLGQVTGLARWMGVQTDLILTNQIAWTQLLRNATWDFTSHVEATPGKGGRVALGFLGGLGVWAATAFIIHFCVQRLLRRYGIARDLPIDPSTVTLLMYAARTIAPWALALVLTIYFTSDWSHSVGGALAFLSAWCVLCGALFASLALAFFSLCGNGHRRPAVRVLLRHSPRWLILFGAMAALNDAAGDVRTQLALGMNFCFFFITLSHLVNVVLLAVFSIRFRRPVAHLIRNNPFAFRQKYHTASEILQFASVVWQWPVLMMAVVAGIGIWGSAGRNGALTDQAVRTVVWLVLAAFVSMLIHRRYQSRLHHPGHAARRSAYVRRMLQFVFMLLNVACWFLFFELILHTWHHSLADVAKISVGGRRMGQVFFSIATTLFVMWIVWIVLDAVMEERIAGKRGFKRGDRISNRARTLLPLFRNALLVVMLIIATILSLANLGINVNPLLAGAGVIGLAVGFGAQALVQDLITGVFILVEDTIAVGDTIDAGGHVGTVEGLTIRTVRIRDVQGAVHSVPFSQIKVIKNMGRDFAYAVFDISVPYEADIDKVLQIMRDTGRELSHDVSWRHLLLAPLEVQGLERFDASAVVVRARFRTRPLQQWDVARAYNLRLKKNLDRAGISMPYPQMDIRVNGSLDLPERTPSQILEGPPRPDASAA